MGLNFKNLSVSFIVFLLLLAWWSSLTIGLSSDEYFHHINGLVRYKYLTSLGTFDGYQFRNNEFYPGLYDTVSYALSQLILLINKKFYANNIDLDSEAGFDTASVGDDILDFTERNPFGEVDF